QNHLLDSDALHALQQVQGSHRVRRHVHERILHAVPNACASRQVEYRFKLVALEERMDFVTAFNIQPLELKPRMSSKEIQPMLLKADIIIGVEVVDSQYAVAACEQKFSCTRGNETGYTNDQ